MTAGVFAGAMTSAALGVVLAAGNVAVSRLARWYCQFGRR